MNLPSSAPSTIPAPGWRYSLAAVVLHWVLAILITLTTVIGWRMMLIEHEPGSEQFFELHKSIEKPSRYRLMAKWETLENHTVDFRGSEDFTAWRGLVGQYFAAPPEVEHTETVLTTAA